MKFHLSALRVFIFLFVVTALASGSFVHTALSQKPSQALVATSDPDSGLLEIGGSLEPPAPAVTTTPTTVKVVSYNIHFRGGKQLQKIIETLRDDQEIGGAGIIGLQEVDRNKERSGKVNNAREMAKALGMRYAWAGQPQKSVGQKEEDTGVALLSRYP
ncbi:MAG: endonuclease/exonuclease/phosphatase family protein, partial [Blastocatellia bacterium]